MKVDHGNALEKEPQSEVARLQRELKTAHENLDMLIYCISHDVRAPLRVVDGFCRLFLEDYGADIPAEGKRLLEHARAGTERMSRLIEGLLSFARASQQPLTYSRICTAALLKRVLGRLLKDQAERSIQIKAAALPDCRGDALLVEQLFEILLLNALKFTRGCPEAVIEIGVLEHPEELAFFVRDNGAGFNMKYAEKLFGLFQRLHGQKEFEGIGAGLAVARRIVQRHGGHMWAEGKTGAGASFYFSLPRYRA